MKPLPATNRSLVLRTDFSDDATWQRICDAIQQPAGEFQADVECVSDPAFDGVSKEQLVTAGSDSYRTFVCVVDRMTITHPEHLVLIVSLASEPGRHFRTPPALMWGVENNLSLGNLDFADFADNVDADGVFRGFPE